MLFSDQRFGMWKIDNKARYCHYGTDFFCYVLYVQFLFSLACFGQFLSFYYHRYYAYIEDLTRVVISYEIFEASLP